MLALLGYPGLTGIHLELGGRAETAGRAPRRGLLRQLSDRQGGRSRRCGTAVFPPPARKAGRKGQAPRVPAMMAELFRQAGRGKRDCLPPGLPGAFDGRLPEAKGEAFR